MNKRLIKIFLSIIIFSSLNAKILNKYLPKHKHNKIRVGLRKKFVDIPDENYQVEGLSKEETKDLVNKIKDIMHKERHKNIKNIIERTNLTTEDIKELLDNVRQEKKEIGTKIEAVIEHANNLIKEKINQEIKKYLNTEKISTEKIKEIFNEVKLDAQEHIDKEIKEHDIIIEKLEKYLEKYFK